MVQTLQQVRDELCEFRQVHGPTALPPESLRKAVVRLCDSHARSTITRELRIGWNTLIRWIEVGSPSRPMAAAAKVRAKLNEPKKIEFVEIKAGAPFQLAVPRAESSASTVEVTRPDGWTVRVTGELAKDFAGAMLGKFTL